ncbi:unnamed protein product [Cuscuta epithymum]|uniref:Uncharacterized protein n=1 Tax=Cuscuta epithymum TaxID=186058 RepID=A0AAV0F1Q1_9ASTE|nr:unnamed protein product [Cuscuta epithymum]
MQAALLLSGGYGFRCFPKSLSIFQKRRLQVFSSKKTPPSHLPAAKLISSEKKEYSMSVEESLASKFKILDAGMSFCSNTLTVSLAFYGAVHVMLKFFGKDEKLKDKINGYALMLATCALIGLGWRNPHIVKTIFKLFF